MVSLKLPFSKRTWVSTSPQETEKIGENLGKEALPGMVFCFFGDLAAGKTTFIKGFVKGACQIDPEQVTSPTFVYLNIYEGNHIVYHFDLYRLHTLQEFLQMGFDEYLEGDGISCIEWSERIIEKLPKKSIYIELTHLGEYKRQITIR